TIVKCIDVESLTHRIQRSVERLRGKDGRTRHVLPFTSDRLRSTEARREVDHRATTQTPTSQNGDATIARTGEAAIQVHPVQGRHFALVEVSPGYLGALLEDHNVPAACSQLTCNHA